jgi:hypothetical protein
VASPIGWCARFDQDTYSNFSDPNFFLPGQFDELDWSQSWGFVDHPITAGDTDVDYEAGGRTLRAGYFMVELPLHAATEGDRRPARRVDPDPDRQFARGERAVDPARPVRHRAALLPGDGRRRLPAAGHVLPSPTASCTSRSTGDAASLAYNETVARQTFKELTPIFQQEYLGGPIFVGNPDSR